MICSNCRATNPAGAKFCSNCGTPLRSSRVLDGERRVVSVMFADVVGSTALAERVDPEVWAELMNGALEFMIAAITRHEGTVGRLMGDAVLALFGAPVAHEDDAARAVWAALDMRAAAADYAEALRRDHGLEFAIRVGINTGLGVVTTVGTDAKAEYTAMGDVANVAARLQALAPPHGVLIGPETYALVQGIFETSEQAERTLKGKAEPLSTYLVLHPLAEPQTPIGPTGVSSPFIGRESELRALQGLLSAAEEGRGALAFVVGEAGLGKSRLLERARELAGSRLVWLEARGVSYARSSPYYLWRQLLKSAPLSDAEGPNGSGALARLAVDEDRADGEISDAGASERFSREVAVELAEHLAASAGSHGTVVVLEDIHWADKASLELLERVAPAVQDRGVLIVCLSRPDRQAAAWRLLERAASGEMVGTARPPLYLTVTALDRTDARELLSSLLDVVNMPDTLRDRIIERSDGNPFYLEEVLRSLIDAGAIVRDGEGWRAVGEIDAASVPTSLAGVLSARMDRLPHPAREVLQAAAVVGRDFDSGVVSAIMSAGEGGVPAPVHPQLRLLVDEDLMNRVVRAGADHRFKHELVRDAAYQRLLLRRRRALHARVARELELRGDGEAAASAKLLAYHYLLGEQWLEGAQHSLVAARQAVRLYALPEALELFEAALTAVEHLELDAQASPTAAGGNPEVAAGLLVAVEAAVGWVNAATLTRVHEDPERRPGLIARAEQAVARARVVADELRLVGALVALGNAHVLSGFPVKGFGALGEAYEVAVRVGDERLFLQPFWAATESMVDEAPAAAVAQFDDVIALARKVGHKAIEAHALGTKAAALARLGEFSSAAETGELALQAAQESGSIIKLADVNALVGAAYLDMGLVEVGLEHTRRGAELALSVNGFECACAAFHVEGIGELQHGELAEAKGSLERSLRYGMGTAFEPLLHNVRLGLVSTAFRDGDPAASVEAMEAELDKAQAVHDGFGVAKGRLALAEVLVLQQDAQRAVRLVTEAANWFRDRSMAPYLLRALKLLAVAQRAVGATAAAAAAESEAQALSARLEQAVAGLGIAPPQAAGRIATDATGWGN